MPLTDVTFGWRCYRQHPKADTVQVAEEPKIFILTT